MNMLILVVEDDKEINRLLCEYLGEIGYSCVSCANGLEVIPIVKKKCPDLIILDLMLPYKSGDQVLAELRSFSDVPVIVLSAKGLVQNKVELMRLGADDYVTKPFDLDELTVRIEAVLRRSGKSSVTKEDKTTYKNIVMDNLRKAINVNGKDIVLSAKEYSILELLLNNPDKLFSKSNLYESVWNEKYLDDDNIIKVHLSNIRTKLKEADPDTDYIETVWGMGYRLKK
ncbi:MAG: response regulator transcription factor [Clostridiales bacterium]|nr:response regulator transcription factor [Clostridiales bacterium]